MPEFVPVVAGWVGAVVLLAGYVQNTRGRWSGTGLAFLFSSVVGAAGLGLAALAAGVWSSAVLNAIWAAVAALALLRPPQPSSPPRPSSPKIRPSSPKIRS